MHICEVKFGAGLPPSPPAWPSTSATVDVQPYPRGGDGTGPIKPLGVDVPKGRKNKSGKNMIIVIVLSSVTAFVVCMGFMLLILSKWRNGIFQRGQSHQLGLIPQDEKQQSGLSSDNDHILFCSLIVMDMDMDWQVVAGEC